MSEELKAAQARIACLEGEIAKRDEELAACRVAVENCDLFRARIAELENDVSYYASRNEGLRTELAAIKAQEPVAWAGAIEYGVPLLMVEPQNWKATPLYAAPVSEAKAQGVVMPTVDQAMRVVLREMGSSTHVRGTSNWCADVGRAVLEEVARLNAAPVQQVSVPDGRRLVKVGIEGVQFGNAWFSHEGITGYTAEQLNSGNCRITGRAYMDWLAAPAAPAADAWISVSERLPGEDDQVLCWCEDETFAWAEVSSHHNSFFTDMTHELLPVTHWMPIPAAPIKIEANRHDQ